MKCKVQFCKVFSSFADIAMFPYLAHLVRFGLPLKKNFPKLDAYYNSFSERASVKKTWPSGWTTMKVKPFLK
jgi:glutathione S-transferase